MKKLLIVANWKSNKTSVEATKWLDGIQSSEFRVQNQENKQAIICPPFTLLPQLSAEIKKAQLPFKLGAQNISTFDEGAFTGEINGKQIKEFAEYVLIGHSERRQNLGETPDMIEKKVVMANKYGLIPILCVQNESTPIPSGVTIVAYEPPSAIGSGKPDTPENAEKVIQTIKENHTITSVLYGGSVTDENVAAFTQMQNIDGVLIGGASLEPTKFLQILLHA
jgi:triosephosphate isomerase